MSAHRYDLTILALGVVAVSSAAVIIREADAPALVIAFYRLGFASIPLLSIAGARRSLALPPSNRDRVLTLLAGLFLALHFAFWIESVQQTSIVTSVVLVAAQPLFVGLASAPLLGERLTRETWGGIALAAVGAAIMVAQDIGGDSGTLLGDFYAVLGAMFAAGYILAGRSVRSAGADWLPYVTIVDASAAMILLGLVGVGGKPLTGYSAETWACFLLLALVPQLIGHTALIRSLGYLPAAAVAVAILGEPVGATILGAIVLDETPTLLQAIGATFVLAGVYVGLRGERLMAERLVAPD